jgi:hypothetical protein
MRAKRPTPTVTPIFLTVDDDSDEPPDAAPSISVEEVDKVMLGVESEELELYTYEVMFGLWLDEFAQTTDTEETKARNWPAET